jgi:hypothetical protein
LRSEPLIKVGNDLIPAGRVGLSPDHLQVGDCFLRIPPLSINVKKVSGNKTIWGVRQRGPIITKTGNTQTEIGVDLWFNDMDDINGVAVEGVDGRSYYMDGLRSLIAHFMRAPIVPVFNETLNDVYDIHTVTLNSLTISTVPNFPGALEAKLAMYATTIEPYMLIPDYGFADKIVWPLFRWYYQQVMQPESAYYLAPVETEHFTARYKFRILDSKVLEEIAHNRGPTPKKTINRSEYQIVKIDGRDEPIIEARILAQKLGLTTDWKSPYIVIGPWSFKPYRTANGRVFVTLRDTASTLGYDTYYEPVSGTITLVPKGNIAADVPGWSPDPYMVDVPLPDDLVLTNLVIAIGNRFASGHIQAFTTPSHQYIGGMEKHVIATFETANKDAVAALKQLIDTADEYSVKYRNKFVSGFLGFDNELTALFGIRYVIVNAIEVETVPESAGLYRIVLSMVDFDKMQREYERIHAVQYIDKVLKAVATVDLKDLTEIEHACLVEEILDVFDLYPDLDLPTYARVADAMELINKQRAAYGLNAINFTPYKHPLWNDSPALVVDPDFYIDYSYHSNELL